MDSSTRLFYLDPAEAWEAALPIGNGRLGAMIFGHPGFERIPLNEDTLWSGLPFVWTSDPPKRHLPHLRELILNRKFSEADQFFLENFSNQSSQSYLAAGNLILDFQDCPFRREYIRELDLSNAIVSSKSQSGKNFFRRESFASYPDQVIVMRFTCEGARALECAVGLESRLMGKTTAEDRTLFFNGACPVFKDREHTVWRNEKGQTGIRFSMAVRLISDGEIQTEENRLTLSNASEAVLLIAIRSNFSRWDKMPGDGVAEPYECVLADLNAAEKLGFAALRRRHIEDYAALFSRSVMTMEEEPIDALPTDERLVRAHAENHVSPQMTALIYNYARYLTIAGSRTGSQAMTLQGIWNRHISPPWRSNYTTNINLEMNYWPAETANLSECCEPLFRLIRELSESGKSTADGLGCEGWCACHNSDLWRFSAIPRGPACHSCWPMAGLWLSRHLFEHYEFTLDKKFLHEVYPILRGAALFASQYLMDSNGILETCPSSSPENVFIDPETGVPSAIARGGLMDMSLIRETFQNTLEAAAILNRSGDLEEKLKEMLPRLRSPSIGPEGQLLEYGEDFPEKEIDHRHLSHLYGAYPGTEFTEEAAPQYYHAAERSLIRRGDKSTGWAMGWRLALWARFRNHDHFMTVLKNFLTPCFPVRRQSDGGVYVNLLCAHPPFQIDGNFGGAAGILEALLQSHLRKNGIPVIRLLPLQLEIWKSGCITGLRARGGLTVNLFWNPREVHAEISASSDIRFIVTCQENERAIAMKRNESIHISFPV